MIVSSWLRVRSGQLYDSVQRGRSTSARIVRYCAPTRRGTRASLFKNAPSMDRLSPAPSPALSRRDWLETFTSRCQAVAARANDALGPSLSASVRLLAADLPATLTMAERLVTRNHL